MKKKLNRLPVFALLCFYIGTNNMLAQTAVQKSNHDKYWNYRERMKRYFIKIGPVQGESVPANWFYSYPGDVVMNWGDATSWLGIYYAVLAMEYKISVSDNKPTTGTLNELYFAINAFNRLDDNDRNYYDGSIITKYRDGFFLRDDVPSTFKNNWTSQYPTIKDDKYNLTGIYSQFSNAFPSTTWSNIIQNEVSQDQLIDIFYGLRFVVDMIPASLIVQPTPADAPMNLVNEAKSIVNRIMGQLTLFHSLKPDLSWQKEPHLGEHATGDVRANWILVNPVTGFKDGAGSEPRPLAYGIATAADKIIGGGSTWASVGIRHKEVDVIGDGYWGADYDVTIPLSSIKSSIWNTLEAYTPPSTLISTPDIHEYCLGLSPYIKSTFNHGNDLCVSIDYNTESEFVISHSNQMLMPTYLAVLGNTWSHSNIVSKSTPLKMYPFDLADAVLNGATATSSQSFYDNVLSTAPCNGPYKFDSISNFSPEWHTSDRWEHPDYNTIPDNNFKGEYIGMDYMMLYNLYHLYYKNASTLPIYDPNTNCDCNTNPAIEKSLISTLTNNINSLVNVYSRFDEYKKYGLHMKEYITHPININAGGTINNRTSLIVCNTTVDVSNGGVFKNASSMLPIDSTRIYIRNGGTIKVNNNSTLEIATNTKLIVQKNSVLKADGANAKIIVRNGAKLILESLGSLELINNGSLILETGGKVILEPTAIATINNNGKLIVEDNGLVLVKTKPVAGSVLWDNAKLIFNQGAEIQLKGSNAVLELNGELHIGDNASFNITYPGSISGYLKFNRGAGVWWDNWAPGNAHITCGNNAGINLIGQSKTDKMIEIDQNVLAMPKNLYQFKMHNCLVEFNVPDAMMESDGIVSIGYSTFIGTPASIPAGGMKNTRGLLVFGQATCIIGNCDFNNLGVGLNGALFYGGYRQYVTNCNFNTCNTAVATVGGWGNFN